MFRATVFGRAERGAPHALDVRFTGRLAALRESQPIGGGETSLVVLLARDDGTTRRAALTLRSAEDLLREATSDADGGRR